MMEDTYKLFWHDSLPNVMIVNFKENLTWESYQRAVHEAIAMIQSVKDRVDIIVYNETKLPEGNPFPQLRSSTRSILANDNVYMLIRTGPRVKGTQKTTYDIVAGALQFDRRQQVVADSIDSALNLIKQDRQNSP